MVVHRGFDFDERGLVDMINARCEGAYRAEIAGNGSIVVTHPTARGDWGECCRLRFGELYGAHHIVIDLNTGAPMFLHASDYGSRPDLVIGEMDWFVHDTIRG